MLPCAGRRVKHRLWAFAEWPVPGRAMLIRRHLVLGAAAFGTLAPTLVACSSSTGEQEAARVGGMGGTFLGLAVALQAEAGRAEQSPHRSSARFMPLQGQRLRQFVRALARPAQRRHRVATVAGSTSHSKLANKSGSTSVNGLRPAPGLRSRGDTGASGACSRTPNSANPLGRSA